MIFCGNRDGLIFPGSCAPLRSGFQVTASGRSTPLQNPVKRKFYAHRAGGGGAKRAKLYLSRVLGSIESARDYVAS